MKFDFSNPMFPKPAAKRKARLVRWQEDLERTRSRFERFLRSLPELNVRALEWGGAPGSVDVVFRNGYRKAVAVYGRKPAGFMRAVLEKLSQL